MKAVGYFLRYLLNINTIWGLMILISFFACVVQHYLPTQTTIPPGQLRDGENTLTLKIQGPDGNVQQFDYVLRLGPEGLTLPAEQQAGPAKKDRPWLISAAAAGAGYVLKWDTHSHGQYEAAVNGNTVAAGKLVTLGALTAAATGYAGKAFEIALGLVATMVLFLGLMKVGEDAGIVQLVARLFYPVIRFLFPQVPKDHPANGAILMNMTTTILGLGNAATPFGLKAMKELHSLNPNQDIASDSQVMLLAYNTAGMALVPTTMLAVRQAAGCSDPFEIIGTCLLAGATSTITALAMAKLLGKLPFFTVQAALAEEAAEQASKQQVKPAAPAGVGASDEEEKP